MKPSRLPVPSTPQPLYAAVDSSTRTDRRPQRQPVLLAGALVLLAISSTACGGGAQSATTVTPTPAAPTASDPCDTTACTTMPNLVGVTASQARDALSKAGFTAPGDLAGKGDTITIMGQVPTPGSEVPVGSRVTLLYNVPPPPPEPAKPITARDWALIAKDPASHAGKRIVVYGQVTQFDAATGTSSFRANVDGVVHEVRYGYADYETNTYLNGTSDVLKDLVNDDLFRAEATVTGAYTYQTTMGGQITVPQLEVTAIKVIGSAK